mmetsp:Transcript_26390/g.78042  ORF Transcript_26390/g.78042 Transcript_26390/m.78042 type:complete len:218 (-) Transcript_26390:597-1250(-)
MILARHNGKVDHLLPLPFGNVMECLRHVHGVAILRTKPSSSPGLERNDAHSILLRRVQHLLANAAVVVRGEIDREHARVDESRFDHTHGHGLGVGRETDGLDLPLLAGLLEGFHRPSLSQYRLHVFFGADGMELIQIQVIRLQRSQGVGQIGGRSLGVAVHGLGGQEHAVAVGLQRRAETFLGDAVAVLGGDVEVPYAQILHGVTDGLVRRRLVRRR